MSTTTNPTHAPRGRRIAAFVTALLLGPPSWSIAAASRRRTFPSAAAASEALFQAARNGDRHAVAAVVGSEDGLASCGDEARDTSERQRFVEKYQQMHRLVREPDGTTVLYVGAENWPFPIPLASSRGRWHFDAEAGRREVMCRQIGANEAIAIEVSRAAVEASKQGARAANSTDPIIGYAERLVGAGRATSGTAGPAASGEKPFHGYRFIVLESNGTTVVAYPADYRSSGVMTFIVGDDGIVYERDLGPDTARVARTLKARPASGWRAVG
jgi:DUF2950 family protein